MNAVRIPIRAPEYNAGSVYRSRLDRLVDLANRLELLVILEADARREPAGRDGLGIFWRNIARHFRDHPNVFFAALSLRFADIIRASGARQPVIVTDSVSPGDVRGNLIYQTTPSYEAMRKQRNKAEGFHFGVANVPVLVDGLDPELDRATGECAAFPDDPAQASDLIESILTTFDEQKISWTLSSFTPGKLITDYRYFIGTKLDSGWTCGGPADTATGIGLVLLSHLWSTTPLRLFTVSDSRGGVAIARGGVATSYGPILADDEAHARGPSLPFHLANVSVRITDSRGTARLARLLYTGAGWGLISFVVPDDCATGPAEVAVVRADGSVAKSRVLIADLAPALFTSPPDGRSAAVGRVTQHRAGHPDRSFSTLECGKQGCRPRPIPLAPGLLTTVRLLGSGLRYAGGHASVRATAGNVSVPAASMGATARPGEDQLTIRIPDSLRGAGDTDLYFTVNGELSNVVRMNFGAGR
jgi:uncharacterized protein (TIGR03437 family)